MSEKEAKKLLDTVENLTQTVNALTKTNDDLTTESKRKKLLYEELQITPKQTILLKYYANTYACKHCEEQTGFGHLELPELDVIHADKTVVQVLKEEGKPAASESRMWVYASGRYCKTPIRFFEYQPENRGTLLRQTAW